MKKKTKTRSIHRILDKRFKNWEFNETYEKVSYMMDLADQIIKARNKAGLSQINLAKKLDTTQSVISRIENGNQNISVAMLQKIAGVLRCSVSIELKASKEVVGDELLHWNIKEDNNSTSINDSEIEIIRTSQNAV